jgi:putative inorganic carbon (hco3(-)) transporter
MRREGPGQAAMSMRTIRNRDILSPAPRPARAGGAGGPAVVLVGTVVIGVALAGAVGVLFGLSLATAALVVAALLGGCAGLLAAMRFEWFLLALLLVRSALDVLDQSDQQGAGVDPAAAIGVLFIVIGGVWLGVQAQAGAWVRPSAATRALWLLVAAAAASVPASSERSVAIEALLKVVAGTIMFAVLEQILAQRPGRARHVLVAGFASLVVPAAMAWSQAAQGDLTSDLNTGLSRVRGSFVHPNILATYLVTLLLVAVACLPVVRGWARAGLVVVVAATVPLLVLTYARAAWGAALLGLVYLGIRVNKRLLGVVVLGVLVLLAAVPSVLTRFSDLDDETQYGDQPGNSFAWRVDYWQELIPLANDNPITGIGLDVAQYKTDDGLRPHNVFVQTYVETGVLGSLALAATLTAFARTLRARVRRATTAWELALATGAVAVALSWLVQAFTENLMTSTVLWWYAAAMTTLGLAHRAPARTIAPAAPPTAPLPALT